MSRRGPRILLIGGTYRALCLLERLIERGERVVAFVGQEGGDERDFCPEILELCDRSSVPARSGRKFGEELVRWLEDRIRPELTIAVGVSTEIPLSIGGNCRLGLVEVIDRFGVESCPGVALRQRSQEIAVREIPPPDDPEERGDVYLQTVEAILDLIDDHLDRIGVSAAETGAAVPFSGEVLREEELHRVVARSEPGEETARLESEVAAWLGAEVVRALGDPADAFAAIARGLGLEAGARVLCPGLLSSAALEGLRRAGLEPLFADVEPDRLTLDPQAAAEAIDPSVRALLISHPFGQPARLGALYALAEEGGLEVIEDAGAALGARFDGSRLGRAPCTCLFRLPFGPAGAEATLATLPAPLAERVDPGLDGLRLGDGAAGVARERFADWEDRLSARRQAASHYSSELARYDAFRVPVTPEEALPSYAAYPLRLTRLARCGADDLHKLLAESGIEARRVAVEIGDRELVRLPATESAVSGGILLPVERGVSAAQRERVLEAIFDYAIG